jgi:hypothetical protein
VTDPQGKSVLEELSEVEAAGEIAEIYAAIRNACAVPYVSSLQRHLATRPGWLEWAWANIAPAFESGVAPHMAWDAAAQLEVARLPPLTPAALRVFGLDVAAVRQVRDVCDSFVRVSPTNLMFSALTRMQLVRSPSDGVAGTFTPDVRQLTDVDRTPPRRLPAPPAMVDPMTMGTAERDTLMQLGNTVAGKPFVPGLYRMLAQWPAYMAHVATELGPHFTNPHTTEVCSELVARIDAAAERVLATLPVPGDNPLRPLESEHAQVLEAMEQYRRTSPQMVVFGTMLRDALPAS